MDSFKERLQAFLKSQKINKSEFARRMGLSAAYVGSMRKSMPTDKVRRLLEIFPQLNRDWLLYGEGQMLVDANEEASLKKDTRYIPLLPVEAYAGRFTDIAEGITPDDCEMVVSPVPDAELAIRVRGDSMEPEIKPDTILYIKKIDSSLFIPWGKPMVLDTENGSLVKVVLPSPDNNEMIIAKSYNPKYPPIDVPKNTIYGVYRILGQFIHTPMI